MITDSGCIVLHQVQHFNFHLSLKNVVIGCDAVVCLSHLGIKEDEMLVHQTRNIDVVLGGHSHTFMQEPVFFQNLDGESIPVSHTGKNGIFVGKIDLTFDRTKTHRRKKQ